MLKQKDISNCDRTYVEKRIPTQYEISSYIVATGADSYTVRRDFSFRRQLPIR